MFKYDLWYDGQVIHSEVDEFETEEEAKEYIMSHLNSFDLEDNQTLGYQKE